MCRGVPEGTCGVSSRLAVQVIQHSLQRSRKKSVADTVLAWRVRARVARQMDHKVPASSRPNQSQS